MTDVMRLLHRLLKTEEIFAPKLCEIVKITGITEILDLCSGSGGPFPELAMELKKIYGIPVKVSLSDLYPGRTVSPDIVRSYPDITYISQSIDASYIPFESKSIRTMFLGFHHMPEHKAKSILYDAYVKGDPICIFEISERSWRGILMSIFVPVIILLFTPCIKPKLSRLLFTYVIPLIPLMMTWDGFVSQLRTYSVEELMEMTAHMHGNGYSWDIGTINNAWLPLKLPYIAGIPGTMINPTKKSNNHADRAHRDVR